MRLKLAGALVFSICWLWAAQADLVAAVTRIDIRSRTPYADGRAFDGNELKAEFASKLGLLVPANGQAVVIRVTYRLSASEDAAVAEVRADHVKSLIEAAAIDGAGPARRFWTIVLPLLSPTTFFLLVVNIVYAFFETFGVIDATTQGGPAQATQILVYKVYHDGVKSADLGGSSAQSVVLMIIVIALTVAQFRFVERKVNY